MKIEYHTLVVEPYLESGQQPVFVVKGVQTTRSYYTLTDPQSMGHSVTLNRSDGVRVPVFAVSTVSPQGGGATPLTHGSSLFAMGLENAIRFMDSLRLSKPIERAIIVMGTNCHETADGSFRAYFGITLEVQ